MSWGSRSRGSSERTRLAAYASPVVLVSMLLVASSLSLLVPPAATVMGPIGGSPSVRLAGVSGAVASANWAGYVLRAPGGGVSDVRGSWVVPAIQGTCPSTDAYSAMWVGIDGWGSNTVEQTGTESSCVKGSPVYAAWYEFYPAASHVLSKIAVHPGDVIAAEVSASGSRFTITLTDVTTGASFAKAKQDGKALRVSAEWIAEAPSSGGATLPLADFGTVGFGYDSTGVAGTCFATVGGVTGTIGDFVFSGNPTFAVTMVSSTGAVLAAPTPLSSDGTSFLIVWDSAGP